MAPTEETAFPRLTSAELALVKRMAKPCDYADGDSVFRAGQPDIDLYVVESGQMEIRNPTDGDRPIVVHEPGHFSGNIDVLTGRPVLVTAVARGPTRLLCVPNGQLRSLLNRIPSLGEKLIIAFTRRRELLAQMGGLGLRVVGPGRCRATSTVREFLYKNFVPYTWFDTETEADLFDTQDVAVIGGGNSAGQAVMFLAECCPSRKVHLLLRSTLGPSMSEYLVGRIRAAANVVVHEQTEIDALHGGRHLEAIRLRNNVTGADAQLSCAAVFVFIGAEPAAGWLPAEIARDARGFVLTGTDVMASGLWPRSDREPCPLETSVPGVLAAGDIRAGSVKRVGFAVGDGSLAVACAHRLVSITG
jgi:hypothetical protein